MYVRMPKVSQKCSICFVVKKANDYLPNTFYRYSIYLHLTIYSLEEINLHVTALPRRDCWARPVLDDYQPLFRVR